MVNMRKRGESTQNTAATAPYAVCALPPMVPDPVVSIGMRSPAIPPPIPAARFVIAVSLSRVPPSFPREGIMPQYAMSCIV